MFCTAKSNEGLRVEEEQATATAGFGELRAERLEQRGRTRVAKKNFGCWGGSRLLLAA
jgi:hypothetical protein